jgi:hypothetical protein
MAYDQKDLGTPLAPSGLGAANKPLGAASAISTDLGFKSATPTKTANEVPGLTPVTTGSYVGNANTGLVRPVKGSPQIPGLQKGGDLGGAALPLQKETPSQYSIKGAFTGENQKNLAKGLMDYANDPSTSRIGSLAANTAAWPPYLATKAVDASKNLYNYATESRANPIPPVNSFAAPQGLKANQALASTDPVKQKEIFDRVEKEKAIPGMPGAAQPNAQMQITPEFQTPGLGAPSISPSTSQQAQSVGNTSGALKVDGAQRPAIDAMTPQQVVQSAGLVKPSDALRPIIHQALMAKPGSQQALDAHEAYQQAVSQLDQNHGGARGLGPEVAALDRASGFNQPSGLVAERQVNPKYAHGVGASMFNFGPNDNTGANTAGRLANNQLPSDYYMDQAHGPAKATYSDLNSAGQHVPGQIVKYDEQGNRAPSLVERSGRSPDEIAEIKRQADFAKSPEGLQQAHMKDLQDEYKHASFMRNNDSPEGLMWGRRADMLNAQMGDSNKTMAGERAERYKADAESGKVSSLAEAAARKEAMEMDKENRKQLNEDREYKFKATKEANSVVDNTVKTYFPDEKERDFALRTVANMANSGQLNNEMILNWRTWLPLVRQAVGDERVKQSNSSNIFTRSTNVNAPTNFGQGEAFGSYTSDSPEVAKKRVLGEE